MVGWEEFIYKVSRTGMTSDFINTVEKKIKQCFHKFEEKGKFLLLFVLDDLNTPVTATFVMETFWQATFSFLPSWWTVSFLLE